MSDIAIIIGAGLGGIGLGTIIAAGYLYSKQDREELANTAAGIAQTLTPDQLAQRSINKRTKEIIEENQAREEQTRKDSEKKIKRLENLYTDLKSLGKTLRPINDKLDDETIPEEERKNLESERSPILKRARKIEEEIKKYANNLRLLAKNNLAFREPVVEEPVVEEPVVEEPVVEEPVVEPVVEEPVVEEPVAEEPVAEEPVVEPVVEEPVVEEPVVEEPVVEEPVAEEENDDYRSEVDETPEDDLNMPIERISSSSFSSNPPAGGSKYFTLTYTPKKSTKKQKSKINRITKRNKMNKRKTKRNKINKRKTKRN